MRTGNDNAMPGEKGKATESAYEWRKRQGHECTESPGYRACAKSSPTKMTVWLEVAAAKHTMRHEWER